MRFILSSLHGDGADGADLHTATATVALLAEDQYQIVQEDGVLGAGAHAGAAMMTLLNRY